MSSTVPAGGAGFTTAPPSKKTNVLGKGGFGLVLKPALPNYFNDAWHEYPDNVTKLFYKKKAMNDIVELAPRINKIVGPNKGHRISTYKHSYKVKNMPADLQTTILSGKSPNNILFPVRMPDLGVDLSIANLGKNYLEIRRQPIGIILNQTLKLLQQVKHIKDAGYIHGDIRSVNVMIRPDSGIMTLIDFDWLKPIRDFINTYPFGFYCHPPETLNFFRTINSGKTSTISSNMITYTKQVLNQFSVVLPLIGYPTTQSALTAYLLRLERENTKPVLRGEITENDLLHTFDSYGLAWTLLPLYAQIYPNSVLPAESLTESYRTSFQTALASRISTDTNLDAAVTAILGMTTGVLVPLSEMKFSERLGIDDAVDRATAIVVAYEAAVSATAVVGGGAAERRHTRRAARKRGL